MSTGERKYINAKQLPDLCFRWYRSSHVKMNFMLLGFRFNYAQSCRLKIIPKYRGYSPAEMKQLRCSISVKRNSIVFNQLDIWFAERTPEIVYTI